MTTLGAELTWPGTRLSSLCGVPWTYAALIRVGIVAHFTKATAAAITPNSYVIILYVRHLCTMHATKTFILLISQCICALHLSFLVSSLFFFGSFSQVAECIPIPKQLAPPQKYS